MRSRSSLVVMATGLALVTHRHPSAAEPAAPAPTGIAAFASHPKFLDAKISPKGTYLAAVAMTGGKRSLVFIDLAARKVAANATPYGETMIGNFYWANDQRVVAELVDQGGDLDQPVSRGEIYSVDAKTGTGRLVFGYRAGEMQTGSHIRKGGADFAWGRIVDTLPNDERRVLIAAQSMNEVGDRGVRLSKLDVYSGVQTFVTKSPIPEATFLTDENGEPRIAMGRDVDQKPRYFYRDPGETWRELASIKALHENASPEGFVARTRTLYVTEPLPGGGFGLSGVGIDDGAKKLLARSELVPPSCLLTDNATEAIVAVEFQPDVPTYEVVDRNHPKARVLEGLLAAYPDEHVAIVSSTDDQKKIVALVYGDRNPGQYLLVDAGTLSAEPIVQVRPWIRPEAMAEMTAFHIKASDGFRIHGYVTSPRRAAEGKPPPMVVLPHGGPHGVRNTWGFDPRVQLLASEGFAVLQVNFRGSGGYGTAYEEAGYRRWGDRVVQDIVDATRFAIRKGFADPRRICIFGASFGAYAALQSAAVAPDLFKCAVGFAGVYDLTRLTDSDFAETSRLGRGYVRTVVGDDDAALRAASPAHNADKIKARVLLVHGKEDRRAPIAHAERLRSALEKSGNPPEWLVEPNEGHGFYEEAARQRMYVRLVSFLRESTSSPP